MSEDALKIGAPAPAFTLPRDGGGEISLADLKGQNVVLFFYPKDDTPGCTIESRMFSSLKPTFEEAGATIIGISKDSVASHNKFRDKYDLTVPLLSDADSRMCEDYGVWVEKKMYGKTFMGIQRSTFLIDKDGKLQKIWRNVKKVEDHVPEVLETVKAL